MNTTTLVIYIIGVILSPIYMFMLWKHKKWNYTAKDLLFGILSSWMSWLGIFLYVH